jgi:DNA-directed RNA polymerase specialized sigma24 family protein
MIEDQSTTDESFCVGWTGWTEVYEDDHTRAQLIDFVIPRLPDEEKHRAEDILHDALWRVAQYADAAKITDKVNYLKKTIHNLCRDIYSGPRLLPANTEYLDEPRNYEEERWYMQLRDPGRDPELNAEINEQVEIYLRHLEESCADLTDRETRLLRAHFDGWTNAEIASAWGEDIKLIRTDVNAVMVKLRYRLLRLRRKLAAFENNGT